MRHIGQPSCISFEGRQAESFRNGGHTSFSGTNTIQRLNDSMRSSFPFQTFKPLVPTCPVPVFQPSVVPLSKEEPLAVPTFYIGLGTAFRQESACCQVPLPCVIFQSFQIYKFSEVPFHVQSSSIARFEGTKVFAPGKQPLPKRPETFVQT